MVENKHVFPYPTDREIFPKLSACSISKMVSFLLAIIEY